MNLSLFKNGSPTRFFRLIFVISALAFAGLLSVKSTIVWIVVSVPFVIIALIFLSFRSRFLDVLFENLSNPRIASSAMLAAYGSQYYASVFQSRLNNLAAEISNHNLYSIITHFGAPLSFLAGVISSLALFVYLYWFITWFSALLKRLIVTLSKVERWFILCSTILCAILIIIVYTRTSLFFEPNAYASNGVDKVDILYTTDTSSLIGQNVFINISARENDIRQPLFGIFSAPFALIAGLGASLLHIQNAYCMLLQIIQSALLILSLAMISSMMPANEPLGKILFLLVTITLFPTMLFALNIEQYIMPVFWLILLIWQFISNDSGSKSVTWVAASGSMLTSGIFLLLASSSKSWRDRIKDYSRSIGLFAFISLIFGRVPMILSSTTSIKSLLVFSGSKLPFIEQLKQYVSFVSSCLLVPLSRIVQYSPTKIAYHQSVVSQWSIPGLIFLILAFTGFLVNRKNTYYRICFGWITFSFLLLGVFGWGTAENGLLLYTLYFYWAFFSLIVALVYRLFANKKWVRYTVLIFGFFALLFFNSSGLAKILDFGISFYPLQ